MNKALWRAGCSATRAWRGRCRGSLLSSPASAQAVSDRTLSDINVDHFGRCTTLTINFNIRVQLLSYFPTEAGQELHIRLRSLDPGGAGNSREALRPPASVTELRSIDYEGDNPSGAVLSLFFTKDMRFEVEAGSSPQSIIVRLDEPGNGAMCSGGGDAALLAPVEGSNAVVGQGQVLPEMPIPAGLYAINLLSQPAPIISLSDEQQRAVSGRIVYETLFERDSQQWHRLRMGFFESRSDADMARMALQGTFPDAWVVKVSAEERSEGVHYRRDTGQLSSVNVPPSETATTEQAAEAARLVAEAEQAIGEGNNDRAVQLLTNALQLPENASSPRAQELLGLTRERKEQIAQAQAEYQEYLRRYPSGEAADRVRQRLAALKPSGETPDLREAAGGGRGANEWSWSERGSLSQFYFRDQSFDEIR